MHLTQLQCQYVQFIAEYFSENDMLPPVAVAAEHFGVYPNAAHQNFMLLQKKGVLEKNAVGKFRRGPAFGKVVCKPQ